MTDVDTWLRDHTTICPRYNGRWSLQRHADLAHTTTLCAGCRRFPKDIPPSKSAVEIARLVSVSGFIRWGIEPPPDSRPDVTMETFE